jgi:hypothetical protein
MKYFEVVTTLTLETHRADTSAVYPSLPQNVLTTTLALALQLYCKRPKIGHVFQLVKVKKI